jgi:hypothetical protein
MLEGEEVEPSSIYNAALSNYSICTKELHDLFVSLF